MDVVYEACKAVKTAVTALLLKDGENNVAEKIFIDSVHGKVVITADADGKLIESAVRTAISAIEKRLSGKVTQADAEKVVKKYGKFTKPHIADGEKKTDGGN